MEFSLIYITVLLISLIASVFVVLTNIRDSSKSIAKLDFRVISMQLIILLAWIIILAKALKAQTPEEAVINIAVFVFSLVIGVLVIQSVIKENKAAEITTKLIQSLSLYNRRLRNLDKQKTDFVSSASHQLRSPNSAIIGYSSMLLEGDYGKLEENQKEIIKKIFDSSNNLNNIINELLDTSRIEQKRMKYEVVDFDLIDVVEEIVSIYKDLAKKKGLNFVEGFDTNYSIMIKGDKEKIRQVITNLLDNAIKYTEKGEVKISIKKENNRALIEINDTGIGISKDDVNKIFNKFVRAENAEDLNVSGSGLGLFIAKEITLANNGDIWAESDGEGKGSKFCVEFATIS